MGMFNDSPPNLRGYKRTLSHNDTSPESFSTFGARVINAVMPLTPNKQQYRQQE